MCLPTVLSLLKTGGTVRAISLAVLENCRPTCLPAPVRQHYPPGPPQRLAGHTVRIRMDNAIFSTLTDKEKPGTVAGLVLVAQVSGGGAGLGVGVV